MLRKSLLLLFLLFTASCTTEINQQYYEDSTYCLEDSDCAIREGACGPESMNIYFDNSELIEMAPHIDCIRPPPYKNPQCSNNICIAETDLS